MLKLYTNFEFLTETHRNNIFPLLFDIHFFKSERIEEYYSLVSEIETCDVVIFPIAYHEFAKFPEAINDLQKQAEEHKKPIWVYTAGDFGYTLGNSNVFNFRLGGFHSKLPKQTFIMPSFISDPYLTVLKQPFFILKKEDKPTIGFVGHAKSGVNKYLKEFVNHFKKRVNQFLKKQHGDTQKFYPSGVIRAHYLNKLNGNKAFKTDFILRNQYRSGVKTMIEKEKTTQEFYQNINDNLYTFCMRGGGNFSVRFYETLAMGRIPILLDTDCRLPLFSEIDWEKHCVILDLTKKESIEQQIITFHNSKSDESIKEIQLSNRNLWKNSLEHQSFFIKIHHVFKSLKNEV